MVNIVATIGFNHNKTVSEKVDELNTQGCDVIKVKRISKMFLGIFGEDVTDIYYNRRKDIKNEK